jgi:hypothetical protein
LDKFTGFRRCIQNMKKLQLAPPWFWRFTMIEALPNSDRLIKMTWPTGWKSAK